MKRGFVLLLLILAACAQREPGKAVEMPIVHYEIPTPVQTSTPTPARMPDSECLIECGKSLQSCRKSNQPQYEACVDIARSTLKSCLTTGDDAYCRFAYSQSRGQCFIASLAGCDILLNSCLIQC